jgi:hypothetical protein
MHIKKKEYVKFIFIFSFKILAYIFANKNDLEEKKRLVLFILLKTIKPASIV